MLNVLRFYFLMNFPSVQLCTGLISLRLSFTIYWWTAVNDFDVSLAALNV